MTDYTVEIKDLHKSFGRRLIFKDINYTLKSKNVYGISGPNGSGKSTIVKIICGLISPTSGEVIHKIGSKKIEPENLHNHIGFVSPYLFLYDEFTAEENLIHFAKIRGVNFNKDFSNQLLAHFNIYERRNDYVKGYSSGMKQRLKFVFAFLHNPEMLILDEPTSNLDNSGKEKVYEIIREHSSQKLIIIASNEDSDLALCNQIVDIQLFKAS